MVKVSKCARCGHVIDVKTAGKPGRPPKYCSDACARGADAMRKRESRLNERDQKPTLKVGIPDVGLFALRYAQQAYPMDGFWESECQVLALAGALYDMPVGKRTEFACRAIEARVNPRRSPY